MSFTAQTKAGPKNSVHLNVAEIERLLAFAKEHIGKNVAFVTVTGSETGIGQHVEVSAQQLNFEQGVRKGIRYFKDISDYESW